MQSEETLRHMGASAGRWRAQGAFRVPSVLQGDNPWTHLFASAFVRDQIQRGTQDNCDCVSYSLSKPRDNAGASRLGRGESVSGR